MIKMIASDMDGTFLDGKGAYDRERFVAILDELDKRGIPFVVATGNSMLRLSKMFSGLLDRISIVAENGAHLLVAGETVNRVFLEKEDVLAFLEYFKDHLVDYRVMLSGETTTYMLEGAGLEIGDHMIAKEEAELFAAAISRVSDFSDVLDREAIVKMSMVVDEKECSAIIDDFNKGFTGLLTAVTSGYGTIDIIQTGVHKAYGLTELMRRFDLSSDQLMAFGDSDNDIEMLSLASHSYAVDNASDKVKSVANKVAPSHLDSGVFQVIEAYLAN